jgi:CheY-like chemotaxis protein
MVLDDDALMLETMRALLQPWGLAVTTLQDPTQFWDVLMATLTDLLLLDLQMPQVSGIDLCRAVCQDPQWGNLPILVITLTPTSTRFSKCLPPEPMTSLANRSLVQNW